MKLIANDHESRLFEMGAFGFIAISPRVNLDDLVHASQPGAIVRCDGDPKDCITFFPPADAPVGCVAGWISEDDQ